MVTEQLIALGSFCGHQGLDVSFVLALQERGLIELVIVQEERFIRPDHIVRVEQLARMHYDLEINLEGLEAISHLLERMEHLQSRVDDLQRRLRRFGELEGLP
ncbi:MAG: chaperone modulator CbpM [Flavobacteriales bacterium]|nr:chaperone modulator CbpM [Flavobacteriales bacterium]